MLEEQRSALEELERIEQAIADRIIYCPGILPDQIALSKASSLNGKRKRPLREQVILEHEVSKILNRYSDQVTFLSNSFINPNDIESKAQELAHLGTDPLDHFYKEITRIRSYHKQYPNQPVESLHKLFALKGLRQLPDITAYSRLLCPFAADLNIDTIYTGEEQFGRYLDLLPYYDQYVNVKLMSPPPSYFEFLNKFYDFEDITYFPRSRGSQKDYLSFISQLHKYLDGYLRKTQALGSPELSLAKIEASFWSASKSGTLAEWSLKTEAKQEKELFCDTCQREFSNPSVYQSHFSGRKHKKNQASTTSAKRDNLQMIELINLHEYSISAIADLLAKKIRDTCANIERKQALTDRERQLEVESVEKELGIGIDEEELWQNEENQDIEKEMRENDDPDDDSDQEGDHAVHNPLKLPLGWDGKPIPFWLWKLNGLGIEYNCEICGNYTYMGRKAFDRHFSEARHSHGLRCLGINPDPLYKGVTIITDALSLHKRIRKARKPQVQDDVEMEDEDGNVMSEKVYTDLKKQGLL